MREPLLSEAADLWIVSDPISRADAIVVLSGGLIATRYLSAETTFGGCDHKTRPKAFAHRRGTLFGSFQVFKGHCH
jgi:hypothetical protein